MKDIVLAVFANAVDLVLTLLRTSGDDSEEIGERLRDEIMRLHEELLTRDASEAAELDNG